MKRGWLTAIVVAVAVVILGALATLGGLYWIIATGNSWVHSEMDQILDNTRGKSTVEYDWDRLPPGFDYSEGEVDGLVDGYPLPMHESVTEVKSNRYTNESEATVFLAGIGYTADARDVADFYAQAIADYGIENLRRIELEQGHGPILIRLSGSQDGRIVTAGFTYTPGEEGGTAYFIVGEGIYPEP